MSDFAAIPSLKMPVLELARCEFTLRRENVIPLDNCGAGKSCVALALGLVSLVERRLSQYLSQNRTVRLRSPSASPLL